jgi:phosphoserine phosphatase RsbU/P
MGDSGESRLSQAVAGQDPFGSLPADLVAGLGEIQSITDAALSRLGPQDLLDVLVDRVRAVFRADTAAVLLLDEAAGHLVATAASGLEEEVRQGVRIPVGKGFAGRIADEVRPVILDAVDATNVVNPLLLDKGVRSLMGAPLVSGGKVLGVLHVGTLTPRRFGGQDVDLLQLAADRAALAVQALAAQADQAAAAALQRSLLPSALPAVDGLRMAARFVPGSGSIGGDWYDVFLLPSGQVCAVIGDVAGSGLKAAVIMGRMRSALRAYALETTDPAEVLDRLDRKMRHFEPDAMATVLCAVFSPELDQVRVSSAGHLPPIIAVPGGPAVPAPVAADTLIGAPEPCRRRVSALELPPGAVLCLYTDGLVERRDQVVDEGIAKLCLAVTNVEPEACCAAAMTAMSQDRLDADDVALLIFRRAETCPATLTARFCGQRRERRKADAGWEGLMANPSRPRHAMLLYRDPRQHGSACAQHLTAGASGDAAAFVAVTRPHANSLRSRLDRRNGYVRWSELTNAGADPGRVISMIRMFALENAGRPLRVVQDVGWLDRPHEDLTEAIRYETLVGDALGGSAVEVLCGYDARLDSALLAAAEQAHSVVLEDGARRAAASTDQAAPAPVALARPLSDPPSGAETITFRADQAAVRRFALAAGLGAGLPSSRIDDLVIAIGELAGNTLLHTDGVGTAMIWATPDEVIGQIHDSGQITDPLAGTVRPDPSAAGASRGLWLVHQVSDLVQVRSGPAGTTIRVHMRLPGARGTG